MSDWTVTYWSFERGLVDRLTYLTVIDCRALDEQAACRECEPEADAPRETRGALVPFPVPPEPVA